MRVERIESPYTEFERELQRDIAEMERRHREFMRPFYAALARSRANKPDRLVTVIEPSDLPDIDLILGRT